MTDSDSPHEQVSPLPTATTTANPIAVVAVLAVSMFVAALVFALGAKAIADNDWTGAGREFALDDGVITIEELELANSRRSGRTGPTDCSAADQNYDVVADVGLPATAPPLVLVPADSRAEDPEIWCLVREERRSAAAGLSVMIAAALAAVSFIAVVSASVLSRGLDDNPTRARWASWFLVVLVIATTWTMAGRYRNEPHLLGAMISVGAALLGTSRVLFLVFGARSRLTDSLEDQLSWVRHLRYVSRAAILLLSIIFSLSVALIAVLNNRYFTTERALSLRIGDLRLGGFGQSDLTTVTALEGLFLAVALAVVAIPALLNVERRGSEVLVRLTEGGAPHTPDGQTRPGVNAIVEREDLATRLGLSTRPARWLETGAVLLMPFLTGAAADVVGLFG